MNYIIIFFNDKNLKTDILIDFLKGLLGSINITTNVNNLIINYSYQEELNLNEIANMIINDLYLDVTLVDINTNSLDYLNEIIRLYYKLDKKYHYLNEKQILSLNTKINNEEVKKQILKEYYNDSEMLHIVKIFLENDLNLSTTASKLYLHRNTLTNKIDKFIKITNYDIKKFIDANIIYQLIN